MVCVGSVTRRRVETSYAPWGNESPRPVEIESRTSVLTREIKSGAARRENRTPVSSSDTTHNRHAVCGSREAGSIRRERGIPRLAEAAGP